jgi:hypothetical protein
MLKPLMFTFFTELSGTFLRELVHVRRRNPGSPDEDALFACSCSNCSFHTSILRQCSSDNDNSFCVHTHTAFCELNGVFPDGAAELSGARDVHEQWFASKVIPIPENPMWGTSFLSSGGGRASASIFLVRHEDGTFCFVKVGKHRQTRFVQCQLSRNRCVKPKH